jgi:hypothetical protein
MTMMDTTRLRLDRIASSTKNARLSKNVIIGSQIVAAEGYVLAVRILDDKTTYNSVEDLSGRMVPLRAGDILAGTLGYRRALHGYAGEVPERIAVGDTVHVLNLGGVLGCCTSSSPELGPPFRAEVLGAVLSFPALGDRIGRPAHIKEGAIPPADALRIPFPIVYVAGTCMNTGKTVAASELVRGLSKSGLAVGACKLTGVSLMRDSLHMQDAGAISALTFSDCGLPSTRGSVAVQTAKGLLNRLADAKPDVVVAELGDGILGEYGVQDILSDAELRAAAGAFVVAAPDPVGCWGAVEILAKQYSIPVTVLTGPCTDNEVGLNYIQSALGLPAHNARRDAKGLLSVVLGALSARIASSAVDRGDRTALERNG